MTAILPPTVLTAFVTAWSIGVPITYMMGWQRSAQSSPRVRHILLGLLAAVALLLWGRAIYYQLAQPHLALAFVGLIPIAQIPLIERQWRSFRIRMGREPQPHPYFAPRPDRLLWLSGIILAGASALVAGLLLRYAAQ